MALLLGALFFVVPFVEMVVVFWIGPRIGWDTTVTVLILLSAAGAWLMKREGLGTWRRIQSGLQAGRMPTTDAVDGFLLLLSGALLLCPGFITSFLGVVTLLPPVRRRARELLADRLRHEVARRIRVVGSRINDDAVGPQWAGAGGPAGPFTNGNGHGNGGSHGPGDGHGHVDGNGHGGGFGTDGFGTGSSADGHGRAYRRPEEAPPAAEHIYRDFDVIDVDGEEIIFEQGELGPAEH